MDLEAGGGGRGSDRFHDDVQVLQWGAFPGASDVAEEAVFDFVPCARSGGEVADLDDESGLIGPCLEFDFPESGAGAIAASAVGGHDNAFRFRVFLWTESGPPAADGSDGEFSGVVANSHGDARTIIVNIVDAVGDSFSELRVGEVVGLDLQRVALRAIRLARLLEPF